MHRLPPPSGGTKKPASPASPAPEKADDSSAPDSPPLSRRPLLCTDPEPPHFESPETPPLPAATPPVGPKPSEYYTSPLLRVAARRAMLSFREHLRGIPHQEIWMTTIDLEGTIMGSSRVAKGGLERLQITLADLLVRARVLGARGIVLIQNRPGTLHAKAPIDHALAIKVDLFCDLLGIPLLEYVFIDAQGEAFFVRERGILKQTRRLRRAMDERIAYLAQKEREREQGMSGKEEGGRRGGGGGGGGGEAPEEPVVYRKRGPRKP